MTDPVLFLVALATLLAMPGPTNTLLALAAATAGWRRALPLVGATLAGYLVAILALRLLLAPIIEAAPTLGTALRIIVALYLVWLAIRLWRQRSVLAAGARAIGLREVFVTTLLNPKAMIVALAVIPPGGAETTPYFAAFALVVVLAGSGWIALGVVFGAAAGARAPLLPRIGALALLGFAGLLIGSAM